MITGLYTGILSIILIVLTLNVIRLRWKYQSGLGSDPQQPPLFRAIRVHGNFIETVPWALALMLLMEMQNAGTMLLHAYGMTLILARLLHAWGITVSSGFTPMRGAGILLTVSLILLGASFCISRYLAAASLH